MGFDNECILNISSLAGEYFCPVCRLLVYPNEALQSQCTHLYCKPCLSYVVSTTRACPYDGYLVTDADSKPLLESNKTLAETIGKITVQCLYHRSGCTWQGALAECIAHCSGCTFGNSPVVCNRCGIQIVHRQVQEHAQNCVSVQPQGQQAGASQDPAATGTTTAATGTTTAAAQTELASQAQSSQTTTASAPRQEPNQQSNPNPQSQGVSQAVVTSEQWFQQQQQQQQYQQYYQQYSGYESYYQQYYPYQQQTLQVSTAQNVTGQHPVYVQSHTQPQTQGQSQVQPQTQVQSQVQPQSQVQSQVQPQPQVQSQVQTQPQVQSQVQTQPKVQLQAQPQSHPSIPIPVATQTLNQAQLNKQQQTHLTRPPLSQIPSQTHLTAQGHPQPLFQPFPQAQPHPQAQTIQPHQQHGQIPQYPQHHSQLQQPQPQIYPTSQALPQAQLQPQPQESQPLNPNLLPQVQHPAAHAVTVNQSYPQPHPHPQMQVVTAQHPVNIHASGALHSQQYPAQMHNFHSQMRPPQPHPTIPNQQHPGLLPSAGPLVQPGHHHSHQPAVSFQQRPTMQAVTSPMSQQYVQQQLLSNQPVGLAQAQMHQQGASTLQQQSFQSQLRPVGPPHSFQQLSHGYSQPQQNVAGSHAMHPHPSHNFGGRPITPNHEFQSQPYPHSAAGTLDKPMHLDLKQPSSYQNNVLRVNNQSGVTSEPISEVPIDRGAGKSLADKEANSSSKGTSKEANRLNMTSSLGADVAETNTAKLEADLKSVDEKATEGVGNSVDKTTKEMSESRHTLGTDLEQHGDLVSKNIVKGDVIKDQNDVHNGEHKEEEIKIKDGHLLKTLPLQEAKLGDEQNGKMQKDKIFPQDQANPEGPALSEFRGVPGSYLQPPHSVSSVDQARHQTLQMPYGSNSNQQRPAAATLLQAPLPPTLPYQFRPQGAGQALIPREHLSAGSFGRGPNTYGPLGTPLYGAPRTSKGESLAGPLFGTPPPSALDSHGAKSYDSDSHLAQRSANMVNYQPDNIRLDPRASGFESTSTFSLRDESLKPVRDERLHQLPLDHSHHAGDRGQFEEDLKQFPRPSHLDSEPVAKFDGYFSSSRPLDRGPHGFGMDIRPRAHEKEPHGFNFDPMIGSGPSRFLPPYPEDVVGRPDFHGTAPSYGRHHMDRFISRSPGREYPCISPRGFGGHPGDEIDGRKQRFNDRFSGFPGHLRRGAYEGYDHLEDRLRSRGMIGQDIRPPHFRRGEHFGHHSMPGHFRLGEPMPLGDFPGHERMGEFGGPGNFRHPRLGEPGFRSSFSLKEFRNDGGIYAGDMDSFENKRKRKSVSMGWCRICNVDCETVEGLDLHSQTREHQKMAMDLVQTIKQNAKKQKIDESVRSDVSKSKISKSESRVNKH